MAIETSDLMMMKMMDDDDHGSGWGGSSSFLWIILIFLFFLAFSGNSLFGGGRNAGMNVGTAVVTNDLSQVERDILTGNCGTQKEVLQNRYDNALAFQQLGSQMQSCCCDLKTTVIEQNQLTRDLIQSQYIDELRTQLSDAKTKISTNEQSQYMLDQLGQWYSNPAVNPFSCYNTSCNRGYASCGGCSGCSG